MDYTNQLISEEIQKSTTESIAWLIEHNGALYWSKNEENNTYVYRKNLSTGETTTFAKVFVPVECFDISGEDLYYLYSGELIKVNVLSNDEETVMINRTENAFYVDDNKIYFINKYNSTDGNKHNFGKRDNIILNSFENITYQAQFCGVNSSNSHRTGLCNVASMTNLLKRKASLLNVDANFT